jgi:hypothetical protein
MKSFGMLIFFIFSLPANCQENQNTERIKSDSTILNQNINLNDLTLELLQGIWAENEEENALLFIEKDSLYYVEGQDNPVHIILKMIHLYLWVIFL